jgi:A/G-specific adenine glycosylase
MYMNFKKLLHFKQTIWDYYANHKRILPWRNIEDPYKVFVSEIMLQQTQVARVLKKYPEFLETFPDFLSLSQAPTSKLLAVWQGMGYNRRALFMRTAADIIVKKYNGKLPKDPEVLVTLPGIGKATAGSLAAFAYNVPSVFIETNIRRVFIHHFFEDHTEVSDKQLYPLVETTLDKQNPREWYYALMDYGVMLAKEFENANKRSKHYSVQSKFEGSARQVRGRVIKELLRHQSLSEKDVVTFTARDASSVRKILMELKTEGFIIEKNGAYKIAK